MFTSPVRGEGEREELALPELASLTILQALTLGGGRVR